MSSEVLEPQESEETTLQDEDDDITEFSIEQRSMHIGPIPPPEILEGYNRIDPSFANRIVTMAEQQSLHRQNLEKIIVKAGTRDSLLGIICGLLIGLASLAVSLVFGLNGRTIESSLLGVSGLVGLVSVFIYGTRSKRNDKDEDED